MTLEKNELRAKRPALPNLRRFAMPQRETPESSDDATTICGKVMSAAHAEFDREAAAHPPMENARNRIQALLGVVSYCYTKGVFSSAEIEERLWADSDFLATFGEQLPTASRIRAFRREHRETILATIEHALQDFCARGPEKSPKHRIVCASAGAGDWARQKAEEMLNMAKFTDSLEEE